MTSERARRVEPDSHDRLQRRILQVCSAVGTLTEYWGFKSIQGRVWTLLALRGQPMSQTEVAETLGVSRSLVSTAVTELSSYGLVRPTGEHRNAPIEALIDIWPVITDILRTREWMLLESTRVALESVREEAVLAGPDAPCDPARAELMLQLIGSVQRLLDLVIKIRMPDTLRGVKDWISGVSTLLESLRRT